MSPFRKVEYQICKCALCIPYSKKHLLTLTPQPATAVSPISLSLISLFWGRSLNRWLLQVFLDAVRFLLLSVWVLFWIQYGDCACDFGKQSLPGDQEKLHLVDLSAAFDS